MNVKRSGIAILILLLLTMMIFTACSGEKPAETPPAQNTEPVSNTAPAPESKPAEPAAVQTPAADTAAQPAAQPAQSQAAQVAAEPAQAPAAQAAETPVPAAKPAEAPPPAAEPATAAPTISANTYKGALSSPIAEQPVLLTSSGQSADVQMVKVLLDRAGIKYTVNAVVKPEEVKDVKTLILAVGGSSKGLGAAGIDAEDELDRTKALISKAKELKLKIIALHIGGEARRGELSDKFINVCVPSSDYVIVVQEGNKDGLFTKLTDAGGIPMDKVGKITEAVEPLKSAFK